MIPNIPVKLPSGAAEAFGKRLIAARQAAGITQNKLAVHVGESPSTISEWEAGLANVMDPSTMIKAVRILEVAERMNAHQPEATR